MRIVKDAEERRNEILDAAEMLFATKGFDATSTGDILAVVPVARGTIYYHFKSKEDILDAVIDRTITRVIAKASAIAGDTNIPFMSRLPAIILSLNLQPEMEKDVKEHIHSPQNALMHQKTQQKLVAGIVPILNDWVEEGKRQGLFHTDFGAVALEMVMTYSGVAFDDLTEQTPEEKLRRVQGLIYNLERMLGAQPGVLTRAVMEIFEKNGEV